MRIGYPNINDSMFESKLLSKREIRQNAMKITTGKSQKELCDKDTFQLFGHQKLVRNFFSPKTPYQNLLLFHDVGMGKTCSAISIAETHKKQIQQYNQKVIILLEDGVKQNFINEIMGKCTGQSYKNKRQIKNVYSFLTLDKFTNTICKQRTTQQGLNEITSKFSNTIIIVDEVHNIREYDSVDNNDECKRYDALKTVVQSAKNTKLLLMSATPMFDNPREIVSLMNLFRANNKLDTIPTKIVFDDQDNLTSKGKDIITTEFKGIISYIRGDNPNTFPKTIVPSIATSIGKLNVVITEMSQSQKQLYIDSMLEQININILRQISNADLKTKSSPKFDKIIKIIDESKGSSFVYSEFIGSSLNILAEKLKSKGYKPYTPGSRGKTYVLLDGSIGLQKRTQLINTFNSKENRYGELIKVILGSRVLKEGITLKNVRHVHITEPWHNMSRLRQVWGRAIRSCSHVDLPPNERNVRIYLHASSLTSNLDIRGINVETSTFNDVSDKISYDLFAYLRSQMKDTKIQKVIKILRETAIDCLVHQDYNRNKKDRISCKGSINNTVDKSTYRLDKRFYNQPDIQALKMKIKKEITKKGYYHIRDKFNVSSEVVYQLTTDKSPIQYNSQNGYIINRGDYLIFQPAGQTENINMYSRLHPEIFKNTKYPFSKQIQATETVRSNNIQEVINQPRTKPVIVKDSVVKGNYKGILYSDGRIALQNVSSLNNADGRAKSRGRFCNTFTGKDIINILKDIEIPKELVESFFSGNKISRKAKLCDVIKKYYYPSIDTQSSNQVVSRSTDIHSDVIERENDEYIIRILDNSIVKVIDKSKTSKTGKNCFTMAVSELKKIGKSFGVQESFKTRKQYCQAIAKTESDNGSSRNSVRVSIGEIPDNFVEKQAENDKFIIKTVIQNNEVVLKIIDKQKRSKTGMKCTISKLDVLKQVGKSFGVQEAFKTRKQYCKVLMKLL
jgi:superfamily II DNA or RNA helicase